MTNQPIDYCDAEELLELLRLCGHRLLLAYGETMQNELWLASEKTAEACQSLLPLIHSGQLIPTIH